MNDAVYKLVEKLPDVYFDWYARILPGSYAAVFFSYLSSTWPSEPTFSVIVMYVLIGYLVGHVLQPISGKIVKTLETTLKNEDRYRRAKSNSSVSPSLLEKISKAHAEANSMMSFAIAMVIVCFVNYENSQNSWVHGLLIMYFLWATWERVVARNRKIHDLPS